ncbi:uncharacterized protein LOC135394773 [Ornithodoros turicata]|uniref:uncharacterized protein LOC135394773 n=1 Tax=Ornithodoros turicata TaxID=34597 RepID=UPI00313A29CC
MASERSRLVGVQTQETHVLVIPQEASINVDSDGAVVTRGLSRVVRVTQIRRIVGVQSVEAVENQEDDCASCCKATFLLLLALVLVAVSLSMIIIGSLYFNECPAQKNIPIYLVVAGVVLLLVFLSPCCHSESWESCYICFLGLACLFLMAWSIAGAVWVFNVERVDTNDPLSAHYCNHIVYTSAKYFAGIGAVLIIALCCCRCCSSSG